MTTPDDPGDTPPSLPPDAATSLPFQWINIGDVSASHGEILIIANLAIPAPVGATPWDRVLGYNVVNPERSPDGDVETFVADLYAPEWETGPVPGHAREDAMIIRTYESGAWRVEARACGQADHPGWCELRIRLHEHGAADPGDLDLDLLLLRMTDEERREFIERVRREAPGTDLG